MHIMWQVIFFIFEYLPILMPKRFLNIFLIFRTVLLLTSPVWTGQFPVSRNNTNATVPATVKTEVTNRKCMPDVPPHILWTVWHKRRVRTFDGLRQRERERGGGGKCFFCNYWNRYTKLKKKGVKRFELFNAIQLLTRIKMIIYRYKSLGFPVFDGSQCHHRFSALRKVSVLLHILLISFYSVFHESGNLVKLYDCVSEFLLPLYM